MSKILVIPDTHLKPKIFDLADKIMHEHEVDYAVQLGDNFDDFYCFESEYKAHYVRMEQFAKDHPNAIWLYGNHEVSYIKPSTSISKKNLAKLDKTTYCTTPNPKSML